MRQLERARQSGDRDAYLAVLVKDERERTLRHEKLVEARMRVTDEFDDALDARFGADPLIGRTPRVDPQKVFHDRSFKIEILKATSKGPGTVEITTHVTQTTDRSTGAIGRFNKVYTVVKEAGTWKVKGEDSTNEADWQFLERRMLAYREVTTDLRSGKYQNRQEAAQALLAAIAKWDGR